MSKIKKMLEDCHPMGNGFRLDEKNEKLYLISTHRNTDKMEPCSGGREIKEPMTKKVYEIPIKYVGWYQDNFYWTR